MSLNDLPDEYNDVMLEIDEEVVYDYNTSIPYRYKYEVRYYTNYSNQDSIGEIQIDDLDEPSEETKHKPFLYLEKFLQSKKTSFKKSKI